MKENKKYYDLLLVEMPEGENVLASAPSHSLKKGYVVLDSGDVAKILDAVWIGEGTALLQILERAGYDVYKAQSGLSVAWEDSDDDTEVDS